MNCRWRTIHAWRMLTAAVAVVLAVPAQAADLRIGVQFGIAYVPFYVAEKEGLFAKHLAAEGQTGVTVEFPRFSGSSALNDAIIAGQIDMAVYGTTGLIVAWDKTRGTPSAVVGVCGVSVMPLTMVTFKPEMKSLKDVGPSDKIVIPALISPSAYVLRMAAEKELGKGNVLDPRIVAMPNPDAVAALMSRREVTAMFSSPPFMDFLLRQPGAHRVTSSNEVFGGRNSSFVLGVAKRYADANPGVVKAMIATLREANDLIARDPQHAADIYMGYEPSRTFDAKFIAEILADGDHGYTTDVFGIMTYVDYLARAGQMKNRPASWKDLFLPYVHDQSGS